jgi:hypothetical protein
MASFKQIDIFRVGLGLWQAHTTECHQPRRARFPGPCRMEPAGQAIAKAKPREKGKAPCIPRWRQPYHPSDATRTVETNAGQR